MKDSWQSNDAMLAERQPAQRPRADGTLIGSAAMIGALYRRFRTIDAIENLNGLIAHYTRNVKRWRDGAMELRCIGTALCEASGDMKRVREALARQITKTCHKRATQRRVAQRLWSCLSQRSTASGTSAVELEKAIRHYFAIHNKNPKPFVWHRAADEIIPSVGRTCTRIDELVHYVDLEFRDLGAGYASVYDNLS